jgi:hypothetical protein
MMRTPAPARVYTPSALPSQARHDGRLQLAALSPISFEKRRNATPEGETMTTFDDRKRAFENKYAHDAEMQFKAVARRNKALGLWAAGLLGKAGAAAEDYAMEVIRADFEEAGHEDVFRKVQADLAGKADEATIRAKMEEFLVAAQEKLMSEG